MWDRNGARPEEKEWVELFNKICETCKEYLIENRQDIGKWDLEMADLKKFNPMYWKRDRTTGKIEPGTVPRLYVKLIESRRDGIDKVLTYFCDSSTGDEINPIDIIGKYCNVTAAIKIESIFIGNRISLQVKLYNAEITLQQSGIKRLLGRTKPQKTISTKVPEPEPEQEESEPEESEPESDGSIEVSDDEDFVETPSPPRKQVKRRGKK
jgi:hypothetical protein